MKYIIVALGLLTGSLLIFVPSVEIPPMVPLGLLIFSLFFGPPVARAENMGVKRKESPHESD